MHILEEGAGRELGAEQQRAPAVDHHAQPDVAAFFIHHKNMGETPKRRRTRGGKGGGAGGEFLEYQATKKTWSIARRSDARLRM